VVRLQERSSSFLAELEELKTAKSSRSLLAPAFGDENAAAAASVRTAGHAKSAAVDKELMLKHIDNVKEVRAWKAASVVSDSIIGAQSKATSQCLCSLHSDINSVVLGSATEVCSERITIRMSFHRRALKQSTCDWRCGGWSQLLTARTYSCWSCR
jgi:hypothetical protein